MTDQPSPVFDDLLSLPPLVRQSAASAIDSLPDEKRQLYKEFEYLVEKTRDPTYAEFKDALIQRALRLLQ